MNYLLLIGAGAAGLILGRELGRRSAAVRAAEQPPSNDAIANSSPEEEGTFGGFFDSLSGAVVDEFDRFFDEADDAPSSACQCQ